MKLIFSEKCLEYNWAGHIERPERVSQAVRILRESHNFVEPQPASEQDLLTDRFTSRWIERWALAESRMMLAEIRGKYATLPGAESAFTQIKEVIPWNDLPLINTIILLSSGVTVTFAHHALKHNNRSGLNWWLLATVILGFLFVYLQAAEYGHAYHDLELKLTSGVYGSTFFMLTRRKF